MPATEQLEQARTQLAGLTRAELAGAMWRIHPRDLAELRDAGVDVERALGPRLMIVADPELEGTGPHLTWDC